MKQVGADKYNIAWFKLADCIARGEKERALGVYRLLSHSLDDKALACQLFGDILFSFQDNKALGKYQEAAALYQENNRLIEAAAVYEHLCTIDPENAEYAQVRIQLYQQLGILHKVQQYVQDLLNLFLTTEKWHQAVELVHDYESCGDTQFAALLYALLVYGTSNSAEILLDTKVGYARKALHAWRQENNTHAVEEFLKKVSKENKELYAIIKGDK